MLAVGRRDSLRYAPAAEAPYMKCKTIPHFSIDFHTDAGNTKSGDGGPPEFCRL